MDDEYQKNPYRDRGDEALEHAEVRAPLAHDDVAIRFKNDAFNGDAVQVATGRRFTGLTKEELMKYANDPFWKTLRWALLILFWLLWVAILAGAVVIVCLQRGSPIKTQNATVFESTTLVYQRDGMASLPMVSNLNGTTSSLLSTLNAVPAGNRSFG